MSADARDISRCKKIVIKIGTNAIIHNQRLNVTLLRSLCAQIYKLRQRGCQVLVITSGAVGLGANELNLVPPIVEITQRQACAAVGQPLLMHRYREAFLRFKQPIGQVLVTREILRNNRRSTHLTSTIETLLADNVIPICNENDSVATEELEEKIRDNDLLGALLARNFSADLFIIMSDIDGFYKRLPYQKGDTPLPVVSHIDQSIMDSVTELQKSGSDYGTGGMYSKLEAIKLVLKSNCSAVIISAKAPRVLLRVLNNETVGTYFPAQR